MKEPAFDAAFRQSLRQLFEWRRDVRHFRRTPLPEGAIERLIELACLSPSVGLSQPWRFVIVRDPGRRQWVRANFETSNKAALAGYAGDRAGLYARLKLAGLDDAPEQLAVFADPAGAAGHGLGRHTMPETIEFSVLGAIYALMLAARADGIGTGWVSILGLTGLADALEVPGEWRFIAYLCLGYPELADDIPMLQRAGWEHRRSVADFIHRR